MNGLLSADRRFRRKPDGPLERLFASLRYGAMRAGAALSSSAESTGPVLQAESLLVPAHDSLLVPLATTARLTAAVELASSDTDEKRV